MSRLSRVWGCRSLGGCLSLAVLPYDLKAKTISNKRFNKIQKFAVMKVDATLPNETSLLHRQQNKMKQLPLNPDTHLPPLYFANTAFFFLCIFLRKKRFTGFGDLFPAFS